MARKWSGFLPLNQATKEEWDLLEACEAQARLPEAFRTARETGRPMLQSQQQHASPRRDPKSK